MDNLCTDLQFREAVLIQGYTQLQSQINIWITKDLIQKIASNSILKA